MLHVVNVGLYRFPVVFFLLLSVCMCPVWEPCPWIGSGNIWKLYGSPYLLFKLHHARCWLIKEPFVRNRGIIKIWLTSFQILYSKWISDDNMWHDQEEWVGCRRYCFWDIGKNSVQKSVCFILFLALTHSWYNSVTRYPILMEFASKWSIL